MQTDGYPSLSTYTPDPHKQDMADYFARQQQRAEGFMGMYELPLQLLADWGGVGKGMMSGRSTRQPMTVKQKRLADLGGWDTTRKVYHGTRVPDDVELGANFKKPFGETEFGLHVTGEGRPIQANDRLIGRENTDRSIEGWRDIHRVDKEGFDKQISYGEEGNLRPAHLPKYKSEQVREWYDLGVWRSTAVAKALIQDKGLLTPEETTRVREISEKYDNQTALDMYKQLLLDKGVRAIRYKNAAEGYRPDKLDPGNYSYALLNPEEDMLHNIGWSKEDYNKVLKPETRPEQVVGPFTQRRSLTEDARGRQMSFPTWFEGPEQVQAFGELWSKNPDMLRRALSTYERRKSSTDPEMMTQNNMLREAIQTAQAQPKYKVPVAPTPPHIKNMQDLVKHFSPQEKQEEITRDDLDKWEPDLTYKDSPYYIPNPYVPKLTGDKKFSLLTEYLQAGGSVGQNINNADVELSLAKKYGFDNLGTMYQFIQKELAPTPKQTPQDKAVDEFISSFKREE